MVQTRTFIAVLIALIYLFSCSVATPAFVGSCYGFGLNSKRSGFSVNITIAENGSLTEWAGDSQGGGNFIGIVIDNRMTSSGSNVPGEYAPTSTCTMNGIGRPHGFEGTINCSDKGKANWFASCNSGDCYANGSQTFAGQYLGVGVNSKGKGFNLSITISQEGNAILIVNNPDSNITFTGSLNGNNLTVNGNAPGEYAYTSYCTVSGIEYPYSFLGDAHCNDGSVSYLGVACSGAFNCPTGQTVCNDVCMNTSSDPLNCGSCGNVCASGLCSSGQCACPSNLTMCNGTCTNTVNDSSNCDSCGSICPIGSTCQSGNCTLSLPVCESGQTLCGVSCIDTSNDTSNCGACNVQCQSGQNCSAGQCVAVKMNQSSVNQTLTPSPPLDCSLKQTLCTGALCLFCELVWILLFVVSGFAAFLGRNRGWAIASVLFALPILTALIHSPALGFFVAVVEIVIMFFLNKPIKTMPEIERPIAESKPSEPPSPIQGQATTPQAKEQVKTPPEQSPEAPEQIKQLPFEEKG